jgi:hypothetical protein
MKSLSVVVLFLANFAWASQPTANICPDLEGNYTCLSQAGIETQAEIRQSLSDGFTEYQIREGAAVQPKAHKTDGQETIEVASGNAAFDIHIASKALCDDSILSTEMKILFVDKSGQTTLKSKLTQKYALDENGRLIMKKVWAPVDEPLKIETSVCRLVEDEE